MLGVGNIGITLVVEGTGELVGKGINMDEEFTLVVAVNFCGDVEMFLGETPDDE